MKTDRLKYFEENNLLNKPFVCEATYVKNGYINSNNKDLCASLITNITIVNVPNTLICHLWVKDTNKIKATKVWKAKQNKKVRFVASFKKIVKPYKLFESKEDLNLKIIKII